MLFYLYIKNKNPGIVFCVILGVLSLFMIALWFVASLPDYAKCTLFWIVWLLHFLRLEARNVVSCRRLYRLHLLSACPSRLLATERTAGCCSRSIPLLHRSSSALWSTLRDRHLAVHERIRRLCGNLHFLVFVVLCLHIASNSFAKSRVVNRTLFEHNCVNAIISG